MRMRRHASYSSVSNETVIKFWEMSDHLPDKQFIQSSLDHGHFINARDAKEAFIGMLQWLAFHATRKNETPPSVVLSGGVDKMLSLFATNSDYYMSFCKHHVGYVVTRIRIEAAKTGAVRDYGGIHHTVSGLVQVFGTELCSTLRNWECMRAFSGTVKSISFVGEQDEVDELNVEQNLYRLWPGTN